MFDLNLFADLALVFFPAVAAALFTDAPLAWSSLFVSVSVVTLETALDNVRPGLTLARDYYYLALGNHHRLYPHSWLNVDNLRLLHIYLLLGRILLHVRLLHIWLLLRIGLLRVGAWLLGVSVWLLRISTRLLVYLLLRLHWLLRISHRLLGICHGLLWIVNRLLLVSHLLLRVPNRLLHLNLNLRLLHHLDSK